MFTGAADIAERFRLGAVSPFFLRYERFRYFRVSRARETHVYVYACVHARARVKVSDGSLRSFGDRSLAGHPPVRIYTAQFNSFLMRTVGR